MNIYYFGIYNTNGGLENFAKNLITKVGKKDKNIHFTIITTSSDFSYREYFEKEIKCDVIEIDSPHKHPIKFYRQMLEICKKANKTNGIVHLNICSFRNYLLFKACKKTKAKTIVVGHYTKIDDGKMPWLHKFNSLIFANKFLCVSNSDDVSRFMFARKQIIHFVNNGVDQERFSFNVDNRNHLRKELKLEDSFIIGQVGRISPEKNQIFSLKVVKELKKQIENLVFLVVGQEFYNEPREFVKKNNMYDYVKFIGPVTSGIERYYSSFDLCFLPSKNEGMSLSLLECATNGVESIFSNAVPKLEVECNYIHYEELDITKWCKLAVEISKKASHKESKIKGTIYDLDNCADSYINIYNKYNVLI